MTACVDSTDDRVHHGTHPSPASSSRSPVSRTIAHDDDDGNGHPSRIGIDGADDAATIIESGDTDKWINYLKVHTPTYAELMAIVRTVDNRRNHHVSSKTIGWKHRIRAGLNMTEVPTRELLSCIGFLTSLFQIRTVVHLQSTIDGHLCYLLRDHVGSGTTLTALTAVNDPVVPPELAPDRSPTRPYHPVVYQSIADYNIRLARMRSTHTLQRTLGVLCWPNDQDMKQLQMVFQNKTMCAIAIIGEPVGGSCITAQFDKFAKRQNYRKYELPVKQVCFLDTTLHGSATRPDQGRSIVSLYLLSSMFTGLSVDGFIMGIGEANFLQPPPPLTIDLILHDHILDGRIPSWIGTTAPENLPRIAKIVKHVLQSPYKYDGCIPTYVTTMDELNFWYRCMKGNQLPLNAAQTFGDYHSAIVNLQVNGVASYWRSHGMPTYIRTIVLAEKWLWVHCSQKHAPSGWDVDQQALDTRFHQLWSRHQHETSFKQLSRPAGDSTVGTVPPTFA